MQVIIQYSNDTSLHIEGFGRNTIMGAVADVFENEYRHEEYPDVEIEAMVVQFSDDLPPAPTEDGGEALVEHQHGAA